MKNSNLWKIIVILAVTGMAGWYLWPSLSFYTGKTPEQRRETLLKNPDLSKKIINLGLDLQGGMRLVLEVDKNAVEESARKDILDRAYTIIENRINGLGVAEPTIQKQGDDRLIVELPGLADSRTAKKVIGSTAQLEFKILREPAELEKAIRTIDEALAGKKSAAIDAAVQADSLNADSATQAAAQMQAEALFAGKDTAAKTVDSAAPVAAAKSITEYFVAMGNQIAVRESNRHLVDEIFERSDVRNALERAGLGGNQFLWGHSLEKNQAGEEYRVFYYVKQKAELKGDIIEDAMPGVSSGGLDAGQSVVDMTMNRDGARKFSRVTGANVEKFMAIVLDSTVYSAPQIRQKISQGRAQITGSFTPEEAKGLAVVLRAGALPAPVTIIEEVTIGPSLGQDSINKAVVAFLSGMLLIVVLIVFYYRLSGVIALFALALNFILLMAAMVAINATLTLPGIAGIVLTLGMAIDANVIIFERMREELALGKTVRTAVDQGFGRAFLTIFDANITTILVAAVLVWLGNGPIKGFGVTMIIGLIVSMFTAVFVSRVIFDLITGSSNVKKLSI